MSKIVSRDNSLDAMRELLLSPSSLSHSSCRISRISQNVSYLSNGLEYSLVEITCDNCIQYGLQAYGEEALELHKLALKFYQEQLLQKEEKMEEEKEGEEKRNREQIERPLVYST